MKNRRRRGLLLHRAEIANVPPFPFNEDRVAAEHPARRQRERGFLWSAFPCVHARPEWFSEHEGEIGMWRPAMAVKRLELVNLLLVNCCGGQEDLSPADHKKHNFHSSISTSSSTLLSFCLPFCNLYVLYSEIQRACGWLRKWIDQMQVAVDLSIEMSSGNWEENVNK